MDHFLIKILIIRKFHYASPKSSQLKKWAKKIFIDSATLANKVLEYFEALIIFNLKPEDVVIRIEPSSRIHAVLLLKAGFYYLSTIPV